MTRDIEKDLFVLSRTEFAAAYPHPSLLLEEIDEGFGGGSGFATKAERAGARRTQVPLRVLPLAKGETSPFRSRIFVGRTKTNDVVVPDERISKVHAFFELDGEGNVHSVADAGSTNGTRVDGRKLESRVFTPVESGQLVSFGPYVFRFVSSEELHHQRHRLATRPIPEDAPDVRRAAITG